MGTYTNCDFSGWATKNDLKCSDGRTIRRNAFADQDGSKVPLVWNHDHDSPNSVCGYAILENRPQGVYAYAFCNDTDAGKTAKELVQHGDIDSFSIYANKLKQKNGDVLHGSIKEVSLVFSGANPGAFIDTPIMAHGEDVPEDEAIIFTGETFMDNGYEELEHADSDDKTVQDVIDEMTPEQKTVIAYLIGQAVQDASDTAKHSDEDLKGFYMMGYEDAIAHGDVYYPENNDTYNKGDNDMKYNVFDNNVSPRSDVLTHSDMEAIISDAKSHGSLKESFAAFSEEVLQHDDGISYSTDAQAYGVNDPSFLFPDAKSLNNPPDWIKRDTEWVSGVINDTHHTPFSRIKSMFADITEDEARAKGYIKGNLKKEEVFSLLKRVTTPQTIYKKQKLDRDDILDITDFDIVAWIKGEMRIMLDEEIARAILIGDGRLASSDDKISEDHIRPIWKDADLFTIKYDVTRGATDAATAKNIIDASIRSRKNYKGSGNPTLFTTEDWLTEMLLLEDTIGHKLYASKDALATAMRVSKIVTVPVMEGIVDTTTNKELIGIIVNLTDYNIGADKGGAVSLFDDFDIDYNQQKYLIETRCSGALIKPYSAIALRIAPKTTSTSEG